MQFISSMILPAINLSYNLTQVEGKNFTGQEFSIIHPTVSDKRVDEQNKVITEGRKIISERVSMLKAKQN